MPTISPKKTTRKAPVRRLAIPPVKSPAPQTTAEMSPNTIESMSAPSSQTQLEE